VTRREQLQRGAVLTGARRYFVYISPSTVIARLDRLDRAIQ
jgi:hypothetical protein